MNTSLHISAIFDKPELLEVLVEKLVCRGYDTGYSEGPLPLYWEAIGSASATTHVNGTIKLDEAGENIKMPFISQFLFTCTKGKEGLYKLTWGISLS